MSRIKIENQIQSLRVENKKTRISDDKYKARIVQYIAISDYCIALDSYTGKFYCFKNFDLQSMKLMSISELDEVDKKIGKKFFSVTIYFYSNGKLLSNSTLLPGQIFSLYDKIIQNSNKRLNLSFKVNTTILAHKINMLISKLSK